MCRGTSSQNNRWADLGNGRWRRLLSLSSWGRLNNLPRWVCLLLLLLLGKGSAATLRNFTSGVSQLTLLDSLVLPALLRSLTTLGSLPSCVVCTRQTQVKTKLKS